MNGECGRFEMESWSLRHGGLSAAEIRAFITTWRPALIEGDLFRVIGVVPRADYDQMLPIVINPAPGELVRV